MLACDRTIDLVATLKIASSLCYTITPWAFNFACDWCCHNEYTTTSMRWQFPCIGIQEPTALGDRHLPRNLKVFWHCQEGRVLYLFLRSISTALVHDPPDPFSSTERRLLQLCYCDEHSWEPVQRMPLPLNGASVPDIVHKRSVYR